MKKVLILAYYFPPCNMPGANRPYGWAKFLAENGYYPVIITRSWENEIKSPKDILLSSGKDLKHDVYPNYEVYYVPYKQNIRDKIFTKSGNEKNVFLRKLLTFWELLLSNFFSSVSSFKSLYYFSRKMLRENPDIKLLIATGAPYLLFRFAYLLNKKFKVKWIADYRDDWNTSDIDIKPYLSHRILRKVEIKREKEWVGSAALHTAVSPYSVEKNSKFLDKKGYTIHNGYMPEDIEGKESVELYDKFTITFIGTLYPTQPIEIFLEAFRQFILQRKRKRNIHLLFPGLAFDLSQSERVIKYLKGFEDYYTISERVPKHDIIKIEQKTHVFLYTAHKMRGIIGSKIYEYVGLKKPVIFCPSDNETIENIFKETGIGYICNSSHEVLVSLNELYENFISGIDNLRFDPEQLKMIDFYSRRNQAKVLADLLDQISITGTFAEAFHLNDNEFVKIEYRQCARCVMDTSDPEIIFDDKGYCNHCNEYFEKTAKRTYQGKSSDLELTLLVDKIKRSGKNKEYDCVIGVSGGVDSIYTAFLAKQLGLRPLAVHMDNGWNSELAVSNIEKILKKLDIDLITEVLDWEEFRDLQLAFLKASVPEAETPTDIAIPAAMHKAASSYNIRYIFSGGNFATEGILPKSWHYNAKDVKFLKAIHTQFGRKKLKAFPTFGFEKEMYYKFIKGIRMIYPLNYVPYNKQEAMKVLEEQLDWKNYGGKHHESIYTKFVQSYLLPVKFGIDYRRATFSTQICAGEMTRDQALQELTKIPFDNVSLGDEKKYLCKKLSISSDDLNEIMNLPPKTYKDYPNDKAKLEFIYNIYRKLNR